jgi:hypothetical protein
MVETVDRKKRHSLVCCRGHQKERGHLDVKDIPQVGPLQWGRITFAVLRLISSSNLVGACTGRSAGFSPLCASATVATKDYIFTAHPQR